MNGRLKKIRWVFFMNVTEMDGFRFFCITTKVQSHPADHWSSKERWIAVFTGFVVVRVLFSHV